MMSGLSVTRTIIAFEVRDIMRSRWLAAYGLFFLVLSDVLLRFGGNNTSALLSLLNVVLFIVPLVTIIFTTVYLQHIREFTELVATQPVRRAHLFAGLHAGVAVPLTAVFGVGFLAPFLWHGTSSSQWPPVLSLAAIGVLITAVFVAIASVITVYVDDRIKALGVAVATWLLFAVLYDGLVMLIAMLFADRALEPTLLGLMIANPVDLVRLVMLKQFDASALQGYTGAVFNRAFTGRTGLLITLLALGLWTVAPLATSARRFIRRDF